MSTTPSTSTRSLLARALAAVAALMRARGGRARRPGGAATPTPWTHLAQLATRFFDARGLAPEHPAEPWPEAGTRMLHKGQRRYLVHAGHWQASRVDAAAIQMVMSAVTRHRATAGILLCAGDVFTPAARALARESAVLLLDSSQLRPQPSAHEGPAAPTAPRPAPSAARATPATVATPAAPQPAPAAPRRPVLRPDHEVRGRRDFMPTVPIAPGELATSHYAR